AGSQGGRAEASLRDKSGHTKPAGNWPSVAFDEAAGRGSRDAQPKPSEAEVDEVMKLKKFRVTQFRSVEDSGWIEADDVTALIGTNESGKTNVLLPLWKLNPAKEGGIVATADY